MRNICIVFLTLMIAFPAGLLAQDPQTPTTPLEALAPDNTTAPLDSPVVREEVKTHSFVGEVIRDNKGLWLSPIRIKRSDAKLLVPLAGGTAFLFATDHDISDAAKSNEALRQPSHFVSNFG